MIESLFVLFYVLGFMGTTARGAYNITYSANAAAAQLETRRANIVAAHKRERDKAVSTWQTFLEQYDQLVSPNLAQQNAYKTTRANVEKVLKSNDEWALRQLRALTEDDDVLVKVLAYAGSVGLLWPIALPVAKSMQAAKKRASIEAREKNDNVIEYWDEFKAFKAEKLAEAVPNPLDLESPKLLELTK